MDDLNTTAVSSVEALRADASRMAELKAQAGAGVPLAGQPYEDSLRLLSEAMAANDPLQFATYVKAVREKVSRGDGSDPALLGYFERLRTVLLAALPEEVAPFIHQYINAGIQPLLEVSHIPIPFDKRERYEALAKSYLNALLEADRDRASQVIAGAVAQGTPVEDIYLYVLEPCQAQVGLLWEQARLSVAQEHYCTAVTEFIMVQLSNQLKKAAQKKRTAVVACVGNELHQLGAQMVATFLEKDGWDTIYLGANTPTFAIIEAVRHYSPALLALSATIASHLISVQQSIREVRALPEGQALKIIVGGYCFNMASDIWMTVGADAHARSAEEAVELANRLAPSSEQGLGWAMQGEE